MVEQEEETQCPVFRWDVFLNFKGVDTRHNFTGCLYNKLLANGIRAFWYDQELESDDEEIKSTVFTAIKESAVSIAVISENYASSSWCLEELARITECWRRRRHLLPVFYRVDPSHVRRQNGPFEMDFRNLEQRFGKDKVLRWKKAMEKAGGISGWDSRNCQEPQLIKDLVEKVLTISSNTPLDVAKYPVGINSRVEELMKVLDVKSHDVRIVVFHGMGGIGKTTLARAVYNKMVTHFEHCSFISNVRETSKNPNGLVSLQNILLHDLFPKGEQVVEEVSGGILIIKGCIHMKRVLVVLDDVDDTSQIDALVGKRDWFYEGSRIIITTRDSQVLARHQVHEIYEVQKLNLIESLELFSHHAFGREKPAETLMHITEEIVTLTGQLPLALEVFGAFMFDKKGKDQWEDALEKLRQIRPGDLHDVLKISYDGLDKECKCIFLDIACFFASMRMSRESAIDIWKGCGFHAEAAIAILRGKSLIKIDNDNALWMHDQLRDTGKQIVRGECPEDPGMHSRLWDKDEIMEVLSSKKGTDRTQGITLDFTEENRKESDEFCNTTRHRISTTNFKKNFENLFNHGRVKDKKERKELAVLDLSESKIRQVWDQKWWQIQCNMAKELKVMNLHSCHKLIATPDFSWYLNLEKLILENCSGLMKIHKSVGKLCMLLLLNLRCCSNLQEFPNDISGLGNLKILILSDCSKLKDLPEDLKPMKSLTELLVGGTAIRKLPDSVCHLTKLERLILDECVSMQQLPNSIGELNSLKDLSLNGLVIQEIPDSIGFLTNLETISLVRCKLLTAVPDSIVNLKSLSKIFLDHSSIRELPGSIGVLSNLKLLSASYCQFLSKLPVSVGGLTSVVELHLEATSITELPDQIGTLEMLEELDMRSCVLLSHLPDTIGNISSLTNLILNETLITELPESIGLLNNLKRLNLNKCKQLSKLPASIGKLNGLHEFLMEETGVAELPEEFGMLSNLRVLKMTKRMHLKHQLNPKPFLLPISFSNLSSLQLLDASSCKLSNVIPDDFEKLSSLEILNLSRSAIYSLPSSLRGLSVLTDLLLTHCIEIKSLPPLPASLTKVDVSNCTALKSLPDLSNLRNLEELNLTNCEKLMDIPGLECLKSLRRLYMSGCNSCHSVVQRFPKATLRRINYLSVPGNEIPDWLCQEVMIFSSRKNQKLEGVIIYVVLSLDQQVEDNFRNKVPAIVDIQASILRDGPEPIFTKTLYLLGVPKTQIDQVYICRFFDYQPLVSLLRDGDRIQVAVRDPPRFHGLQLKKYGISLVFEDDDDADYDDDETQKSITGELSEFLRSWEKFDHKSEFVIGPGEEGSLK
ncbi:PREDICTED: TMV resistance protein N-like [Nelumbo nucifera]|uniref:TMV resistance protein N-like n=1 Tax=Nelumbo nucifera TaxID=4432 RepID=A0A1U8Q7E4_NELNU|nr:PREDICTED: TMV resistance protein N-like [Nelumbo nucifera]